MIRDFINEHRALTAAFVSYNFVAVVLLVGRLDTLTFWAVLFAFAAAFVLFVALAVDSLIDSHRVTPSQGAPWLGRPGPGRTRRGWAKTRLGRAGQSAARSGAARHGKD